MNNKKTFFAELKKHENLEKFDLTAKSKKLAKVKKVALGLIDEFSYGDVTSLEDEVSRLGYSTEEWFDEKFDTFVEARGVLRDVYFMNSEAFIDEADVARDRDILADIARVADEIGLPVENLYQEYTEHLRILDDLDYYTKRFDEQKRELENYGL